jgi:hypothetical protein
MSNASVAQDYQTLVRLKDLEVVTIDGKEHHIDPSGLSSSNLALRRCAWTTKS